MRVNIKNRKEKLIIKEWLEMIGYKRCGSKKRSKNEVVREKHRIT